MLYCIHLGSCAYQVDAQLWCRLHCSLFVCFVSRRGGRGPCVGVSPLVQSCGASLFWWLANPWLCGVCSSPPCRSVGVSLIPQPRCVGIGAGAFLFSKQARGSNNTVSMSHIFARHWLLWVDRVSRQPQCAAYLTATCLLPWPMVSGQVSTLYCNEGKVLLLGTLVAL